MRIAGGLLALGLVMGCSRDDNPVLWQERGHLLLERGRLTEAEEAYRAAIRLAPAAVDLRINLAQTLGEQGRANEALEQLNEALAVSEEDPVALRLRAKLTMDRGDYDAARRDIRQALLGDAGNPALYELRAQAFVQDGESQRAAEDWRFAIDLAPERWEPRLALARDLATREHGAAALQLLEEGALHAPMTLPALQLAEKLAEAQADTKRLARYRAELVRRFSSELVPLPRSPSENSPNTQ